MKYCVEPSIEHSADEMLAFLHPRSAVNHLGLCDDKNVVELELTLPWDPLSAGLSIVASLEKSDRHFVG